MSLYAKTLIIIVWLIAISGCLIMKKIQPENSKLYMIYVFMICLIFTIFQCGFVYQG